MPSRNIIRHDASDSYYHVYARGAGKAPIFLDEQDNEYFLYLLSRHLSEKPVFSKTLHAYPHYRGDIELLCYCLMGNHFHLLFYQKKQGVLSQLMKSIMVSYTAYFNHKYKRSGPLFESRFKASLINKDAYLLHVSRYIHLNPRSWRRYPYSSFRFIEQGKEPVWLQSGKLLEQHESRQSYKEFVADYEESKQILDELKHELANM